MVTARVIPAVCAVFSSRSDPRTTLTPWCCPSRVCRGFITQAVTRTSPAERIVRPFIVLLRVSSYARIRSSLGWLSDSIQITKLQDNQSTGTNIAQRTASPRVVLHLMDLDDCDSDHAKDVSYAALLPWAMIHSMKLSACPKTRLPKESEAGQERKPRQKRTKYERVVRVDQEGVSCSRLALP